MLPLKQTATDNGYMFGALMDALRMCSLGRITVVRFRVGGPGPPQHAREGE